LKRGREGGESLLRPVVGGSGRRMKGISLLQDLSVVYLFIHNLQLGSRFQRKRRDNISSIKVERSCILSNHTKSLLGHIMFLHQSHSLYIDTGQKDTDTTLCKVSD
jgi:hypothetical protein